MSETRLLREIQMEVSRLGGRVFRNNVGIFTGSDGSIIRTGLCNGSSDLVGWFPLIGVATGGNKIEVALFLAIEVKTPKGRLRPGQREFIDCVNRTGGIAFVARSVKDVEKYIFEALDRKRRGF